MAKSEYFRDRHLMAVQDAARAAGIKGATLAVLSYMCSASAFKKPTVCVSKETIAARTGYSVKTIKAALSALRASGLMVAIACQEGGRHRATVYKLTTKHQNGGNNFPPNHDTAEKGGSFFQKGGKFFPERGEETSPPSISYSISYSRREKGRALAAPDAGPHGPSGTVDEARAMELRQFSRDVMQHGYTEARRLAEARAAGLDLR